MRLGCLLRYWGLPSDGSRKMELLRKEVGVKTLLTVELLRELKRLSFEEPLRSGMDKRLKAGPRASFCPPGDGGTSPLVVEEKEGMRRGVLGPPILESRLRSYCCEDVSSEDFSN